MSHAPNSHAARASRTTLIAAAVMAALFCFVVSSVSMPGEVLGATTTKTTLCHANLRATPSTSARVLIVIRTGAKVIVAATVTGTSWRTTCAGVVKHGTSWVRISAVNGKSVRSLYGVTYVYAASAACSSPPRRHHVHPLRRLLRVPPEGRVTDGSAKVIDQDRHEGDWSQAPSPGRATARPAPALRRRGTPGTGSRRSTG